MMIRPCLSISIGIPVDLWSCLPLFFDHPPFNSSLASHLQQPPNGIPIDLSLLALKPSLNSTTPLSPLILRSAAAFPNEASTLCRSLGKHVAECLFKTRCAHASTFAHSAVAIAAVAVRRHGPRILQGAPANVPLKVTQLRDRDIPREVLGELRVLRRATVAASSATQAAADTAAADTAATDAVAAATIPIAATAVAIAAASVATAAVAKPAAAVAFAAAAVAATAVAVAAATIPIAAAAVAIAAVAIAAAAVRRQ